MVATGQNFEMFQGDTKRVTVTVYDEEQPALLNIAGAVINWVVYRQTTGEIVLQKTTTSGITLTVPASGIFEISLSPLDTLNLQGKFNHEAELTDGSDNISTIMTGIVTIYKSKA